MHQSREQMGIKKMLLESHLMKTSMISMEGIFHVGNWEHAHFSITTCLIIPQMKLMG